MPFLPLYIGVWFSYMALFYNEIGESKKARDYMQAALDIITLQTKKGTELDLVEPAGIEPASARLPKVVLHA